MIATKGLLFSVRYAIILLTTVLFFAERPLAAQWSQNFGGDGNDVGNFINEADGGYIIVASTTSFGAGDQVYLIKVDHDGKEVWSRTIGTTGTDTGHCVQQTTDKGYIIIGTSQLAMALTKTDSAGGLLWTNTFPGKGYSSGSHVEESSDGGYILLGSTSDYDYSDIFLVKTDSQGNEMWSKTYGTDYNDFGKSVKQTRDGGYIIAGSKWGASDDAYVIKTDSFGNVQWDRSLGGGYRDSATSVQQTADGGYIVAGYMGDYVDAFLARLDEEGNELWRKSYGGNYHHNPPGPSDRASSVRQTTDGGFAFAGASGSFANTQVAYAWLVKTDENGTEEWYRIFGGGGGDAASSLLTTSDGAYVMVGHTLSFGGGSSDVYLIYYSIAPVPRTLLVPSQFPTIQSAIDEAHDFDTILLADGVYKGPGNKEIDYKGKQITVKSENGPSNCIIDCEGQGRGFLFRNGERQSSVLSGLTIMNANAGIANGGAIYWGGAGPRISGCVFISNTAARGGAIGADTYTSLLLRGIIDGCLFIGNQSTAVIDAGGGAIYFDVQNVTISNCIFTGNSAAGPGGAIRVMTCSQRIINCTMTGNHASGGGGISGGYQTPITNCIIWGNTAKYEPEKEVAFYQNALITYCNIDQEGFNGFNGNIRLSPLLVDPNNLDFRLTPESPCIDAGTNASLWLPAIDFHGNLRVADGNSDGVPTVDIGAFEYASQAPGQVLFGYIDVRSDNHQDYGWRLSTAVTLNDATDPIVLYSVDGKWPKELQRVTIPYYQNIHLYDAFVTDVVGKSPLDYNGSTFTWSVNDIVNNISATATVSSGIREVPLSTNFSISGNPVRPTISWYNPDVGLDDYVLRIMAGEDIAWQVTLPHVTYGANPVYTITDFSFEHGRNYSIRVEAREWVKHPFTDGSDVPVMNSELLLMNRSTVVFPYTLPDPVSFSYIEVVSNNHFEDGWGLSTSIILNNPISPTVSYSVDGGPSKELERVNLAFYNNMYIFAANVIAQIGGSPADYNGSTFQWVVDDNKDLSAMATINSGIREIPLSTNVTISGNPVRPTISWYNADPNLHQYAVRVIAEDLALGWIWQTHLPFGAYGPNPVYTFSDFEFVPGVDYWIRIESREGLSLPFTDGSDVPTPTSQLQLVNRSIIVLPYFVQIKGDINGDRSVDLADAIMAIRIVTGISVTIPPFKNNIDGDMRIGLEEAIYVLGKIAGLRD